MTLGHTRISILGCGHVGTACAYAILHNHLAREIVLIGDTEDHVHGEALDFSRRCRWVLRSRSSPELTRTLRRVPLSS